MAATVAGGVAIGVQVTVGSNTSHNTARIDLRGQSASLGKVNVGAGGFKTVLIPDFSWTDILHPTFTDSETPTAANKITATVGSGAVALGVVSFNYAHANNTSVNNAEILGNEETELTADNIKVKAVSTSRTRDSSA